MFDRGLDMAPYFVHAVPEGEPHPVYDLYGIVNHYGGIMGGHYTAYTRCVNDIGANEVGKMNQSNQIMCTCHIFWGINNL
jgi:hypothetical protein